MKAKLKFEENGKCVGCLVGTNDASFTEMDVVSLNADDNHKEPYKSQFRYSKIKEKQKEIIAGYSYIPGLSVGHQQDTAWKNWIESVIVFHAQYENIEINEDLITFPEDPNGDSEVVDFR